MATNVTTFLYIFSAKDLAEKQTNIAVLRIIVAFFPTSVP